MIVPRGVKVGRCRNHLSGLDKVSRPLFSCARCAGCQERLRRRGYLRRSMVGVDEVYGVVLAVSVVWVTKSYRVPVSVHEERCDRPRGVEGRRTGPEDRFADCSLRFRSMERVR